LLHDPYQGCFILKPYLNVNKIFNRIYSTGIIYAFNILFFIVKIGILKIEKKQICESVPKLPFCHSEQSGKSPSDRLHCVQNDSFVENLSATDALIFSSDA
jgi:hypothetical protein